MAPFSDRYLYLPPRRKMEGRQSLLWPVYTWKVLYPSEYQRLGANLFQEALLGLIRAGVRDPEELGRLMALDAELVRFIIASQLQPNGWLDPAFKITRNGEKVLDEAEDSRIELKVGYAFQDAISGAWMPRFSDALAEIAPTGTSNRGHPEFLLDRGRGKIEAPFVLRPGIPPRDDRAGINDAYRQYRRDVAVARRTGHTVDPGVSFQAIETLGETPTPMYLWCELYRDTAEPQPWLVSDPFRLRPAVRWLRKPLIGAANANPALLQRMQQLVGAEASQTSGPDWLERIEEMADLEILEKYTYLGRHALIREHLGRVLRQQRKIDSRSKLNGEDLSALMGEAHNLLEAVLQWLLQTWTTERYPRQKYWSRSDAEFEFGQLGLPCVTPPLIQALAGQQTKTIAKAIVKQGCPLKGLLAGTLFCAAEHDDHPFRLIEPTKLQLERLPALADLRNDVSGHASGRAASLDKVLDASRFAVEWMTQFQPWY